MGKATGVFLILAGLGTASLVLPSVDQKAEQQLADVVRIAMGTGPAPSTSGTATNPTKAAPVATVTAATEKTSGASVMTASSSLMNFSGLMAAIQPGATPMPATAAPEAAPVLIMAPTPAPRPSTTTAVASSDELTRAIQSELQRVGCYVGDVDGDWGPSTKLAMRTFIERVNATLPVDQPDHILKMLVQGHPGAACGVGCPAGQAMASGRCVPSAIQAQRRTLRPSQPRAVADAVKTVEPAKSKIVVAEVNPTGPAASVNTASIAQVGKLKVAPANKVDDRSEAAPARTAAVAPLPGRMAIGGPVRDVTGDLVTSGNSLSNTTGQTTAAKSTDDANEAAPAVTRAAAPRRAVEPAPRREQRTVRVYREPPPPVSRAVSSYSAPRKRFGVHIFSEAARWGK